MRLDNGKPNNIGCTWIWMSLDANANALSMQQMHFAAPAKKKQREEPELSTVAWLIWINQIKNGNTSQSASATPRSDDFMGDQKGSSEGHRMVKYNIYGQHFDNGIRTDNFHYNFLRVIQICIKYHIQKVRRQTYFWNFFLHFCRLLKVRCKPTTDLLSFPGPVALMDLSATRISVRQIATRRRNTQIRKSAVQLESGIIRKQTAAVPPLVDITSMGISTCASLLQSPVPLALEPLKRICEIAYRPPTHSFSSSFPSFFCFCCCPKPRAR